MGVKELALTDNINMELHLPPINNGSNPRLMEKPGATTTHRPSQQNSVAWGEKGVGGQHTQYIRRLADLRDELLSQEETALARALDRLRTHSISNRDAARYRLKMKGPGTEGLRMGTSIQQNNPFPRPMLTTVEKFRQMRPQRQPPVIFPLQGKQLIECSPTGNGSPGRSSSDEDSPGLDDTVKANLQRLLQPTSSIPNIGRKALRQESLELKPHALHNMRGRVYKSRRTHLGPSSSLQSPQEEGNYCCRGGKNAGGDGVSSESGDGSWTGSRANSDSEFHLSPQAFKLGPLTDGDRLNVDKLHQYYYICCLPDTTGSREKGTRREPFGTSRQRHPQGQTQRIGGQKRKLTKSERFYANKSFPDSVISSDTEVTSRSINPRYKNSVDIIDGSERVKLPGIQTGGDDHLVSTSNHHGRKDAFTAEEETAISDRVRKRHIVVDMPHIIFNAATPEVYKESSTLERFSVPERPGTLSKTLEQNEIRQKELHDLLEDVKELNKRTETLSAHANTRELKASASMS